MTVAEVVRRGTEMLDERRPGWWEEINTVTLNIASADRCVLGQIYGGYGSGLNALTGSDGWSNSSSLGFAAGASEPGGYHARMSELTTEWRAVIEERQREAKARERINSLKSTPVCETADLHC